MAMIDSSDSRFAKAVAIADQAGQWAKCRFRDGRKAYGIRSSCKADRMYIVTQTSCDCFDAQRHVCKHQVAVLIHVARMAGKPLPASDVVDGLVGMVNERRPVLDMIREPDGSIRWERHDHADGTATFMPRPVVPAETIALAARYDRIFDGADEASRIFGKL